MFLLARWGKGGGVRLAVMANCFSDYEYEVQRTAYLST